ncbi:prolipoprotein diacylglyceryl transferase [Cesiribacter andamanensis]|uniref:Phosphatidylglycerol--prolipoprotein diacylglyceryl transferase n=1 Tax=Cesiribacter andamanensis AMV16 TaxID=1279009 RepID=M7NX84_9BACT|nr:prolipoprotein diacylglyceryl transferase [Cesiribacter andamanensis]EMR03054.1 Prolipoprotein diacylglyceryl transferase [Cesiribacter andamanensis AMV16]
MELLHFIVWDPDPSIFSIFGLDVRWYGLMFAVGFLIGQQIMFYLYRQEGKPAQDVETLTIFMVVATIIGARLGHVFFYEPDKYLSDPIQILNIRGGGLASHGAAIGILTALFLYVNYLIRFHKGKFEVKKRKRPGQSYLWVVDKVVIVTAFIGALIRIGNFMNSEIVGMPTQTPEYGVVFGHWLEESIVRNSQGQIVSAEASAEESGRWNERFEAPVLLELEFRKGIDTAAAAQYIRSDIQQMVRYQSRGEAFFTDPGPEPLPYSLQQRSGVVSARVVANGVPRHPTQLYEAASYLFIFFLLFAIWSRYKGRAPEGLLFGIFLVTLFGFRFIWEFMKENQVAFEEGMVLNMGQWLSIPLVLAGVYFILQSLRRKRSEEPPVPSQQKVS